MVTDFYIHHITIYLGNIYTIIVVTVHVSAVISVIFLVKINNY